MRIVYSLCGLERRSYDSQYYAGIQCYTGRYGRKVKLTDHDDEDEERG